MSDTHCGSTSGQEGLLLSLMNSQYSGAGEGAGRDHYEEGAIAVAISIVGSVGAQKPESNQGGLLRGGSI